MPRRYMRTITSSITITAALVAVACSETGPVTGPSVPGAVASVSPEFNARHLFHTKDYYAKANAGGKTSGTGIYYHGGPILAPNATNVVAVYWSAGTIYTGQPAASTASTSGNAGDNSLIGYFLAHLGGSTYFNINTTYYAGSSYVSNAVNYTGYWATGNTVAAPTSSPTDANMIAMLQAGFNSGKLAYDAGALYAIFTGHGVNLGGGFGSQYCAYHTHGTVTVNGVQKTVLYAAMPYNIDYPSGCTAGYASPNNDAAADAEVNTLAHETEETTTDELGTAWYDRRGYENADKCAWTFGTTFTSGGGTANVTMGAKNFLVQRNWVNAGSGGCALHL